LPYLNQRCSIAAAALRAFHIVVALCLSAFVTVTALAADDVVPRLLLSGSEAADADKEANKAPEPPRITSVFGTQTLKEYKLPFEDQYPSGPFERLDKKTVFVYQQVWRGIFCAPERQHGAGQAWQTLG